MVDFVDVLFGIFDVDLEVFVCMVVVNLCLCWVMMIVVGGGVMVKVVGFDWVDFDWIVFIMSVGVYGGLFVEFVVFGVMVGVKNFFCLFVD